MIVASVARSAFPWFESYQAASASLYDQVWMTGWRFTSSIPAIMRSLSSCFEVTRMWAQDRPREFGEEALDEIEPRTMLGREGKLEASRRSSVEPGCCFSRYVRGMIIEDQLDRGAGRISGVETLEEFDELPAAVAVFDERMNLAGKQVDSGQQAQRAMTFVLVAQRWCGRRAWAANRVLSLRWLGFTAFRRRKRSPLA